MGPMGPYGVPGSLSMGPYGGPRVPELRVLGLRVPSANIPVQRGQNTSLRFVGECRPTSLRYVEGFWLPYHLSASRGAGSSPGPATQVLLIPPAFSEKEKPIYVFFSTG